MSSPRVTAAVPLSNHQAKITFADGYTAEIDLRPALHGPAFEPLLDERVFRQMFVNYDTICWPNGADIAPETLRYWCELGRVASEQETDAHFATKEKAARVAEEPP